MLKRSTPVVLAALCLLFVVVVAFALIDTRILAQDTTDDAPVAGTSSANVTLQLKNYAGGLNQPVGIAGAGDYRLFVLEKAGRIKIVQEDGTVVAAPFLDISSRVDSSSKEEGLLGLAFHPRYLENGLFYVNYTNTTDDIRRTRISSFKVSADPNVAIVDSENLLLTVDQPDSNHNAGKILFGPDGYLYIPLGDGGDRGEPNDNAQNEAQLLGKINRIDVDSVSDSAPDCKGLGSGDYTIPAGNPYIDGPDGACDEIWAFGLRNPWQSSFDSLNGDLFVADVGQSNVEELNFQPAESAGGENYGWRCYEGSLGFNPAECDLPGAYTFPIFEYYHSGDDGGCSVTGGYVYRGQRYPTLYGRYLLTDYCSGRFWDLVQQPDESWQVTQHDDVYLPGENSLRVGNSTFGQRCDGELFVAHLALGEIYHLSGFSGPDSPPGPTDHDLAFEPNDWVYLPLTANNTCR